MRGYHLTRNVLEEPTHPGQLNMLQLNLRTAPQKYLMHVAADAMERITRPHFEYVDPYTQHDINQLESVQKFAPKMISHNWDVGYEELVNLVNLQS